MSNHWNNRYINNDTPWLNDTKILQPIKEYIEKQDKILNVLEIGCATGKHSLWIAEKGHVVSGIDISQKAIDQAIEKSYHIKNISYVVGDFLNIDLLDNHFDLIIDVNTLRVSTLSENNRYDFVSKVHTLLKENGYWLNITSKPNKLAPNIPQRDITYLVELLDNKFEIIHINSFTSNSIVTGREVNFDNWSTLLIKK